MNALVTGVAGFIGSTLASRLVEQGATVTGIDCFTDYYPRFIKEANLTPLRARPSFHFVEAALQDTDLSRLLDGVTHVFHNMQRRMEETRKFLGNYIYYRKHNLSHDKAWSLAKNTL